MEKPIENNVWNETINKNSEKLNKDVMRLNYLSGSTCVFEKEPLERLAAEGQLVSYLHEGFWQCMDTQRDKGLLENLWHSGNAPWKVWEDNNS